MYINNLHSEEKLKKKGVFYLGWQSTMTEFKTCDKRLIKIEDGMVEKTQDKCPDDSGPGAASQPIKGTIGAIDLENRMIEIKEEKGTTRKLFFPKVAEQSRLPLEKFKVGDSITVFVPTEGRADFGKTGGIGTMQLKP
jgi:hypothetical protein